LSVARRRNTPREAERNWPFVVEEITGATAIRVLRRKHQSEATKRIKESAIVADATPTYQSRKRRSRGVIDPFDRAF
jgi:hypothetical protein